MDFEEVYIRSFSAVYRFLLSLSRDPHVAEELAQETFLRAMRYEQGFQGRCAVDTWLCSIAKNCWYAHLRKEKRYRQVDMEVRFASPPDADMAEREQLMAVHQALHSLPEPYKEVFTLRVFGGLAYQQIGLLFEKSDTWARVTYYRAKGKLQEMLKEENHAEE